MLQVLMLAIFAAASASELLIDCHPDRNANQSACHSRGCVWESVGTKGWHRWWAPSCTYPTSGSGFPGYDLVSVKKSTRSVRFRLSRRKTPTLFGGDYDFITAEISVISDGVVRLKIQDDLMKQRIISGHHKLGINRRKMLFQGSGIAVSYERSPFGLEISNGIGQILFSSIGIPGFTFAKQFLQFSTRIPARLYGLGEHVHGTFRRSLQWKRWVMFAQDHAPHANDGMNLYGSFPFYMAVDSGHHAHGLFLANSHAVEAALQPNPDIITLRTIGGILDLYIFTGPRPDDVVSQFTKLVGRPILPPYWGLGFQLCRFGYSNLTYLRKVFDRNRREKIPQDIQYTDIDYMDGRKDFTVDSKRYRGFKGFLSQLHSMDMKYVPIVDPGISATARNYTALTDGLKQDVFIKSGRNESAPFNGQCWAGDTYWPDFTKRSTFNYWYNQHKAFRKLAEFDGVWNDMNEPSNEVSGERTIGCAENDLNNPPYNPLTYDDINQHTVCMDARQHAGRHYEIHNLFGYTMTTISNKVMRRLVPGKRPFVLSRSTFPGSGKYVAHWSGDISNTWDNLRWSIISLLDFNLFGIPWVGADICGFDGNTNEELCVRWQQLGAFYPFARNHNSIENTVEQDPAAWSTKAVDAIRNALLVRYYFLPYLYTLFYDAHTSGKPVVRALFYSFPDNVSYDVSDQFLWGDSLMIAPIVEPNSTQRNVYFPEGIWYSYYDGSAVGGPGTVPTTIPYDRTGIFIHWGAIYPVQKPGMTTAESRKKDFGLIIANGPSGMASGRFFLDDGESASSIRDRAYSLWLVTFEQKVKELNITITPKHSGYDGHIDFVQFYGVDASPTAKVFVNKRDVSAHASWHRSAGILVLAVPRVPLRRESVTIEVV